MAKKLPDLKAVINAYIKTLESMGVHVEKVILYGSQATGHARPDSDIDIVIISKDLARFNFPERLGFLSRATLKIHGPLEVIGYTPDEVRGKEGKSIFWDEICENGREVYKAA